MFIARHGTTIGLSSLTKAVVDSHGALREVRANQRQGDHAIASLELGFEFGAVCLVAVADDDTIAIHAVPALGGGEDVSGQAPWRDAIGRGQIWVWSLRNNKGYEDGCQLEFGAVANDDQPEHLCVQLMVAASAIHLSTVNSWLTRR